MTEKIFLGRRIIFLPYVQEDTHFYILTIGQGVWDIPTVLHAFLFLPPDIINNNNSDRALNIVLYVQKVVAHLI